MFRLSWDRRDSDHSIGFAAEFMDAAGRHSIVARTDLSKLAEIPTRELKQQLTARLDEFETVVLGFIKNQLIPRLP